MASVASVLSITRSLVAYAKRTKTVYSDDSIILAFVTNVPILEVYMPTRTNRELRFIAPNQVYLSQD